jgi:hypothetical protein
LCHLIDTKGLDRTNKPHDPKIHATKSKLNYRIGVTVNELRLYIE